MDNPVTTPKSTKQESFISFEGKLVISITQHLEHAFHLRCDCDGSRIVWLLAQINQLLARNLEKTYSANSCPISSNASINLSLPSAPGPSHAIIFSAL